MGEGVGHDRAAWHEPVGDFVRVEVNGLVIQMVDDAFEERLISRAWAIDRAELAIAFRDFCDFHVLSGIDHRGHRGHGGRHKKFSSVLSVSSVVKCFARGE